MSSLHGPQKLPALFFSAGASIHCVRHILHLNIIIPYRLLAGKHGIESIQSIVALFDVVMQGGRLTLQDYKLSG